MGPDVQVITACFTRKDVGGPVWRARLGKAAFGVCAAWEGHSPRWLWAPRVPSRRPSCRARLSSQIPKLEPPGPREGLLSSSCL